MQNRLSIAVGLDASLEDEARRPEKAIESSKPIVAGAIGADAEDKGRI